MREAASRFLLLMPSPSFTDMCFACRRPQVRANEMETEVAVQRAQRLSEQHVGASAFLVRLTIDIVAPSQASHPGGREDKGSRDSYL